RREGGFSRLQQIQIGDQLDEAVGALALGLEIVAELQGLLDVGTGLAVHEQGLGTAVLDEGGLAVDAQDQPLLSFIVGEDEGIAAHIRRNVGVGAQFALVADEQVFTI